MIHLERTLLPGCLALACAIALAVGCSGNGTKPDKPVLETGDFDHLVHLADTSAIREGNGGKLLECGDCHESTKESNYVTKRPGSNGHAPCDSCHAEAFYEKPGKVCAVCHSKVDPLHKGKSPLHEYPRRAHTAQLISDFSHAEHLGGGKATIEGKALDCNSCHAVESKDSPYATFPTHAACVECHAQGKAQPAMDDCNSCHNRQGPGRARQFTKNDIRFTHGKHQTDKAGAPIDCKRCHYEIVKNDDSAEVILPRMADCATCHEDANQTPDRVRIKNCGVCHTEAVDSQDLPGNHTASLDKMPTFKSLADVTVGAKAVLADNGNFIPVEKDVVTPKKPDDHTILFRTRHAEAASSKDAKCHYCHAGLSGSPRNSCNECHTVMRPRNHTLRWQSVIHGREAARDGKRCNTCHEVDYCTECHNIAPPNHSPLATFRYRHDRVARFNPRSCMTCHTFEATCLECHTTGIGNPLPGVNNPLRFRRGRGR